MKRGTSRTTRVLDIEMCWNCHISMFSFPRANPKNSYGSIVTLSRSYSSEIVIVNKKESKKTIRPPRHPRTTHHRTNYKVISPCELNRLGVPKHKKQSSLTAHTSKELNKGRKATNAVNINLSTPPPSYS